MQSKAFEQATKKMGDTIEDIDIEIERKGNKIGLLENKIGLPDSKIIEHMRKRGLNKITSKRKSDRIIDRLNSSFKIHKYI